MVSKVNDVLKDKTMGKILIADDDLLVRWSLLLTFRKEGYEVYSAQNGREALEEALKGSYNLIITDLVMPEMSGLDLLKKLKERFPGVRIIVVTAFGSKDVERDVLEKGAYSYIEKPFKIDELKSVIKKALQNNN